MKCPVCDVCRLEPQVAESSSNDREFKAKLRVPEMMSSHGTLIFESIAPSSAQAEALAMGGVSRRSL